MSLPAEMRAVVFERPDVFAVRTVPAPRALEGYAVVKVRAAMVCATDRKILAGSFAGTTFPHVPGHEFAGEVVAVGPDGRGPVPGTRVGVEVHVGCGACARCREGLYNLCLNYGKRETGHAHVGFTIAGGLADYASVPLAALHPLPASVTTEDGAWTDNLGVALWALERGRLAAGERVVVVGPGAIGLCAAQLARAQGAGCVVVLGRAGERLERARAFADDVASDATALFGTADLVVEFAGTADAARDAIRLARRGGRVVLGGATGQGVELAGIDLASIVRGHLDILGSVANPKGVSGRALALLARGGIDVRSLVTHRFGLERFADAWQTFIERRDGAIRVMLIPEGN
ncbi:MAG TPA: alcohol dehydrogenase catalytic domain-containing protein [Candidatus Limnocylindria bacterium]|nr:alcohol dehydrogenase catalytic domain-containing protein [Candidatus Limnocylindria bacterium]